MYISKLHVRSNTFRYSTVSEVEQADIFNWRCDYHILEAVWSFWTNDVDIASGICASYMKRHSLNSLWREAGSLVSCQVAYVIMLDFRGSGKCRQRCNWNDEISPSVCENTQQFVYLQDWIDYIPTLITTYAPCPSLNHMSMQSFRQFCDDAYKVFFQVVDVRETSKCCDEGTGSLVLRFICLFYYMEISWRILVLSRGVISKFDSIPDTAEIYRPSSSIQRRIGGNRLVGH